MKYNIMRNKLFVIGILLCSNITHAQQRIAGLNKDIHVTKVGVKPYEMKNTSLKKATLSFMDCSKKAYFQKIFNEMLDNAEMLVS